MSVIGPGVLPSAAATVGKVKARGRDACRSRPRSSPASWRQRDGARGRRRASSCRERAARYGARGPWCARCELRIVSASALDRAERPPRGRPCTASTSRAGSGRWARRPRRRGRGPSRVRGTSSTSSTAGWGILLERVGERDGADSGGRPSRKAPAQLGGGHDDGEGLLELLIDVLGADRLLHALLVPCLRRCAPIEDDRPRQVEPHEKIGSAAKPE